MTDALVSVVIDTYNYGHFIEEAIESVLSQDFRDRVEILVIDDGSTDDTADRVKKYRSTIQYFRKPNGGQASAFNFGFANARGEIVALLDADDFWLPGKLQRIIKEFEAHPEAGMVYHRLREYDMRTGESHDASFTPISGFIASSTEQVLMFNAVPTSGVAFRRRILECLLPVPEGIRIQADGYLETLATFLAPVAAINESLAVYRIHGSNLYFRSGSEINQVRQEFRINTLGALVDGMARWFELQGYARSHPQVRATLNRWQLMLETEEFKLSPPGRIKFFRHLLKSYRHTNLLMTPRIRAVNYFNAVGVLFVGYNRFHILDESRQKASRWLRHGNPLNSYLGRKSVGRHELKP